MSGRDLKVDPSVYPELPVGCGVCGRLLGRGEDIYSLWIRAPYGSWGTGVCRACHERYGDEADMKDLHSEE